LTHGAQGMFRWVDLQIQSLRKLKLPADIEARLGRLPRTLADSYLEIYQQIRESGEHAVRLATFTFQWLLYAQQRLGVNDFARLASVYLRQEIAHTADEILDACQNFIVCEGKAKRPRFLHLSVREFLEELVEMGGDAGRITSFTAEEGNAAVSSAFHPLVFCYENYHQYSDWNQPRRMVMSAAAGTESNLERLCVRILVLPLEQERTSQVVFTFA
jgi:hypothetical protein